MAAGHNDNAAYEKQKRAVWVATIIMGVVTIAEVAIALNWPEGWGRGVLNLLFILMSAVKAVFIVGEFMHLRYEMRAMMISILAPCLFLIWFLIAFMMEGQSWLALREFWN
jgi:cytochrome c oxidase subunit IV